MTQLTKSKKIYIKTYGCQMNVFDSNRMQDLMFVQGYEHTEVMDDADMVIINTCHIREKASEKLFSDLGRIKPFKEKKQNKGEKMIIAVAGCVAQAQGEEIFKRAPLVDIVVGPESYQTLPDLVGKVIRDNKKQINLEFTPDDKFDILPESKAGTKASSFVTIQEGCDKFCTFCVVPYTRGSEYSRPTQQIYDDILKLVDKGVKEIYLLGQNVNAYHGLDSQSNSNFSLAKLIEKIATIDAVKRIRYTTSHPKDMSDDLIDAHKNIDKLMPFLHLPLQSGSNNILKAMNRKHTRQDYLKIIEKLRKARPDIGLSSDFIVGFPGETEQDFLDSLDLVEQLNFTQCYSFKYSPRFGTLAADAKIQIDEKVKEERLARLQALLTKSQIEFNNGFEGKTMPVLFEHSIENPKISNKKLKSESKINGQLWGKSPYLQSVIVDIDSNLPQEIAQKFLGQIVNVKILKARPSSLVGEISLK
jgi:tRNA-2-methylthio-N6-dimethylallyladenosine synthase